MLTSPSSILSGALDDEIVLCVKLSNKQIDIFSRLCAFLVEPTFSGWSFYLFSHFGDEPCEGMAQNQIQLMTVWFGLDWNYLGKEVAALR